MMRFLDYKSASGLSESCLARKIGIWRRKRREMPKVKLTIMDRRGQFGIRDVLSSLFYSEIRGTLFL